MPFVGKVQTTGMTTSLDAVMLSDEARPIFIETLSRPKLVSQINFLRQLTQAIVMLSNAN